MSSGSRAPKQWSLTENESLTSYEAWQANLLYILALDDNFAPFLSDTAAWAKKTAINPNRSLRDDGNAVPEASRKTATQKLRFLELMLGQIANYAPIISRNTIIRNSTSLSSIWQALRLHYGFQTTGAHFLDFNDIRQKPEERPETLYQRLMSFVEDNLLRRESGLTHHGNEITTDEDLTPTLENFVVLIWLRLIHEGLPRLVKQKYGTELRSRTLSSIKPEISQALDSLLDELSFSDETKIMRTQNTRFSPKPQPVITKTCPLCKQAGRRDYESHYLTQCRYLPERDKKYISKGRLVNCQEMDHMTDDIDTSFKDETPTPPPTSRLVNNAQPTLSRRVGVKQSPFFTAFYGHHTVTITLDSGAEINMIRTALAKAIGVPITKSTQTATQADGKTHLSIHGETHITLSRHSSNLVLDALIVDDLDVDILAGMPFFVNNDIAVRPSRNQILIGDNTTITYTERQIVSKTYSSAHILRATTTTTLWPGDYIELFLPPDVHTSENQVMALEPRLENIPTTTHTNSNGWLTPQLFTPVGGTIRLANSTYEPVIIKKHDHICQVLSTLDCVPTDGRQTKSTPTTSDLNYLDKITVDPDNILPINLRQEFNKLHKDYNSVFDPVIGCYNGAVGPIQAVVNMGPVQPPQRKGRMPQYSKSKLDELQLKFDELEQLNVLQKPEDLGIVVEYLNPSFLIKKPDGSHRLVTAFGEVGKYSKPQPSLMPDVQSTLQIIAQWQYIIVSDLTKAFYQIPLSHDSLKYCGVATPFRGVRVYTRTAMGMPGSETALEELMCRVLGDLLQEGIVTKLADDLYCGGDTPQQLLENWKRALNALQNCNLHLSSAKTTICPRKTTILGWIWNMGKISASPHVICTLSTVSRPTKVKGLRSFIGAYKVLARVLPDCAAFLNSLEKAVAGQDSKSHIQWDDNLEEDFQRAQDHLKVHKTITLPRYSDKLWIVTDGSVKQSGIGSTLYIQRGTNLHLAGFFSAKLKKHQITWLPCEIEALSITAAIRHYSPYIIQSNQRSTVLTDSKPCVEAYNKLCRGEFSASSRVTTFLSNASRYQVTISHLAGTSNIPSDFASRNAPSCSELLCQICSFINTVEDSTVRAISADDVITGKIRLPFSSRSAWLQIQHDCPDLRRTHAHLTQGTRPSKKATDIKDVKRYLRSAQIAKDGLLVVRKNEPLAPTRECIIVPRPVLHGLLTALHLKFGHPSKHQLRLLFLRNFSALDLDAAIELTTNQCHTCSSLQKIPPSLTTQETETPPSTIGIQFAADVIKRYRQLVLILRETVTSYTTACLIENEQKATLRSALLQLCLSTIPVECHYVSVRVDPAPGFTSLVNDELLKTYNIHLDIGRTKNINKNPVAEKAISEFTDELLKFQPHCTSISALTLSVVCSRLNTRIRGRGLSAREMWTLRDQFSNEPISVSNQELIQSQHDLRLKNHPYSEKSKACGRGPAIPASLQIGDIIYLKSDRNKRAARDRYLVINKSDNWCNIQKFAGTQLRSKPYHVKVTECFKVPAYEFESDTKRPTFEYTNDSSESDEDIDNTSTIRPTATMFPHNPDIPEELILPATTDDPPIPQPTLATGFRRSSRQKKQPNYLQDFVI